VGDAVTINRIIIDTDYGRVEAAINESMMRLIGRVEVLQVPVYAPGPAGHLYLGLEEYDEIENHVIIQEMIRIGGKNL